MCGRLCYCCWCCWPRPWFSFSKFHGLAWPGLADWVGCSGLEAAVKSTSKSSFGQLALSRLSAIRHPPIVSSLQPTAYSAQRPALTMTKTPNAYQLQKRRTFRKLAHFIRHIIYNMLGIVETNCQNSNQFLEFANSDAAM